MYTLHLLFGFLWLLGPALLATGLQLGLHILGDALLHAGHQVLIRLAGSLAGPHLGFYVLGHTLLHAGVVLDEGQGHALVAAAGHSDALSLLWTALGGTGLETGGHGPAFIDCKHGDIC